MILWTVMITDNKSLDGQRPRDMYFHFLVFKIID